MKIKQTPHKRKIWILVIIAAVVVAGLLISYVVFGFSRNSSDQTTDQTDSKNEPKSESEKSSSTTDKTTPPNTDGPAQTEKDDSGKRVVPVVTSVNVDGSMVYIRGGLNTPEADGTCFAALTGPNNEKVQKDTTLLLNANSTDCKTISIPTSEFSTGQWSYTLNFSSSSAKGQSSVTTFTIN